MVLVCVTDQESCGRLIDAGKKLADITENQLKVICVRPRRTEFWFGSDEVEYLFNYSKKLGAEMIIIFHDYAVEAVVEYLHNNDVQYVIVGMPPDLGQSIFISGLEEKFPQLPVITLGETGQMQLVPAYDEKLQ
ncbi:MAG TPA: hypothetical protein DD640_04240 [Clostridiales bacterium]|nr:hypothetical protein [Clostridiales bacterium]